MKQGSDAFSLPCGSCCTRHVLLTSNNVQASDMLSLPCRDLPVDPRALLGSVDIRETDKDFQFLVDVPGLTRDDVKVRVSADGILTIEGERKVRSEHIFLRLSLHGKACTV